MLAGAGDPSAWKAELLVAAGADVLLLAPEPSPKLAEVIARGRLRHERRAWRESDFDGALVAIVEALDDAEAERFRVAARRAGRSRQCDRPPGLLRFFVRLDRRALAAGDRDLDRRRGAGVRASRYARASRRCFPRALRDWANAARAWRPRFAGFDLARRRAIWAEFCRARAGERGPRADRGRLRGDHRQGGARRPAHRGGVGPGAGDLVTLRAVRALQAAEFIVEDGVIDPRVRGSRPARGGGGDLPRRRGRTGAPARARRASSPAKPWSCCAPATAAPRNGKAAPRARARPAKSRQASPAHEPVRPRSWLLAQGA